MRNFILLLSIILLYCACNKKELNAPQQTTENVVANIAVAYKDNSVSIVNFKAQPDDNGVKITFTTLYAKNIVRLEVLRGYTANNLCSIYKQDVNADSYAPTEYSASDLNETKASNIYYIIKYTLANGDWGYTPVFELSM